MAAGRTTPPLLAVLLVVTVVIDRYSRRVMAIEMFSNNPTAASVQSFLQGGTDNAGATPKHLIRDTG